MHIETTHLHINEALSDLDNAYTHISAIVTSQSPETHDIRDELTALNRILGAVVVLLDAKQHDVAIMNRPDPD